MTLEAIGKSLQEKDYPLAFPGHWVAGQWIQDRRSQELSGSFNPSSGERIVKVSTSRHHPLAALWFSL